MTLGIAGRIIAPRLRTVVIAAVITVVIKIACDPSDVMRRAGHE